MMHQFMMELFTIEITDNEFIVDLRDNPDQIEGPINSSRDGVMVMAQQLFKSITDPKPKRRWDVHLPGAGNRGRGLAGVSRPLIAGPSGAAGRSSSFRLDSPARNLPTLSCTAALLPKHSCQWPPLSPNPRWPHRR